MGFVICDIHSGQGGELCCSHISDAAYGKTNFVPYKIVKLDLFSCKDDEIPHYICDGCLEKFKLTNIEYVPEEIWVDEKKFPYVGPVCHKCLKEYETT